jgi:hypothetical protein
MRQLRLTFLLLLAISLIAVNCTKEGPEGPVGPTGAQGPAGSNGTPGTPGAPGPAGSANVIYSAWAASGVWGDTTMAGVISGIYRQTAPGVTQSIIDNGVVLVYAQITNSNSSTVQLPFAVLTVPVPFQVYYLLYPGAIHILASSFNGTARPGASLGVDNMFRYVIVPGGVLGGRPENGSANSYSADQLRHMSYSEICTLFNIPAQGASNQ